MMWLPPPCDIYQLQQPRPSVSSFYFTLHLCKKKCQKKREVGGVAEKLTAFKDSNISECEVVGTMMYIGNLKIVCVCVVGRRWVRVSNLPFVLNRSEKILFFLAFCSKLNKQVCTLLIPTHTSTHALTAPPKSVFGPCRPRRRRDRWRRQAIGGADDACADVTSVRRFARLGRQAGYVWSYLFWARDLFYGHARKTSLRRKDVSKLQRGLRSSPPTAPSCEITAARVARRELTPPSVCQVMWHHMGAPGSREVTLSYIKMLHNEFFLLLSFTFCLGRCERAFVLRAYGRELVGSWVENIRQSVCPRVCNNGDQFREWTATRAFVCMKTQAAWIFFWSYYL